MERARDTLTTDDIAGGTAPEAPSGQTRIDGTEPMAPDAGGMPGADATGGRRLLAGDATEDLRRRWEDIQGGFVDEPRHAVEEADRLVAELMRRLADQFSAERRDLEGRWDRGGEVSTEDLRVALQRYRSFFDRLLSA